MIDDPTKKKFLKELAKTGNIYVASMKVNISRSSHYRWKLEDKEYRQLANKAEKFGRANNCDIAEHALMLNVRDKKMDAIKYVLAHNSSRYKPKRINNVTIEHISGTKTPPEPKITFEDILYEAAEKTKRMREEGSL